MFSEIYENWWCPRSSHWHRASEVLICDTVTVIIPINVRCCHEVWMFRQRHHIASPWRNSIITAQSETFAPIIGVLRSDTCDSDAHVPCIPHSVIYRGRFDTQYTYGVRLPHQKAQKCRVIYPRLVDLTAWIVAIHTRRLHKLSHQPSVAFPALTRANIKAHQLLMLPKPLCSLWSYLVLDSACAFSLTCN